MDKQLAIAEYGWQGRGGWSELRFTFTDGMTLHADATDLSKYGERPIEIATNCDETWDDLHFGIAHQYLKRQMGKQAFSFARRR